MLRSVTTENHSNQEQARNLGNSKNQSDVSKACIRLAVSADREEQGWQSLPQGEKMVKWQGNK